MSNIDRCVMCGEIIPEGKEVCNNCRDKVLDKKCINSRTSSRISKDEYYLGIALAVSERSTCLKRQYGCVIVKNDEIIATGYNGSPRGEVNCCDRNFCNRMNVPHNTGNYADCHSVHAEQNAMLSACRKDMMGSTLYLAGKERRLKIERISWDNNPWQELYKVEPCPICSRMIKNSGIVRVVCKEGDICL